MTLHIYIYTYAKLCVYIYTHIGLNTFLCASIYTYTQYSTTHLRAAVSNVIQGLHHQQELHTSCRKVLTQLGEPGCELGNQKL